MNICKYNSLLFFLFFNILLMCMLYKRCVWSLGQINVSTLHFYDKKYEKFKYFTHSFAFLFQLIWKVISTIVIELCPGTKLWNSFKKINLLNLIHVYIMYIFIWNMYGVIGIILLTIMLLFFLLYRVFVK